ncbi:MAG: hypothetical protein ABIH20_00745 [Candidatus Diapherotrites archaeon]
MRIRGGRIVDFWKNIQNSVRKSRFNRLMNWSILNDRKGERRKKRINSKTGATFFMNPAEAVGMKKPKPEVVSSIGAVDYPRGPAIDLKEGVVGLKNRRVPGSDRRKKSKKK